MPIGTVKFFNTDKGYGFIAPEDGGADSFVHISAVQAAGMQTLNKDQRLSYEVERGRNGKESAINLVAGLTPSFRRGRSVASEPRPASAFGRTEPAMSQTFEFYDQRARAAEAEAEQGHARQRARARAALGQGLARAWPTAS